MSESKDFSKSLILSFRMTTELIKRIALVRDILSLYGDFARDVAMIEKKYQMSFGKLKEVFAGVDAKAIMASSDKNFRQVIFPLFELGQLQGLGNLFELDSDAKIAFAGKTNNLVKEFEAGIGKSDVITRPRDLDPQLILRCSDKDYHDTITNAFSILEDTLREKLGVDRGEYHGDKLIDYAFNPSNGQLIVGVNENEKQGVYFLFKGTFAFLRNPPAHTLTLEDDRSAAIKVMHMVDFLIKLVNESKNRSTQQP